MTTPTTERQHLTTLGQVSPPAELATVAPATPVRSKTADDLVCRNGALQRVTDTVRLSFGLGQFYTMDRGKSWTITAEGWRAVNKVAGMQLVPMPNVSVDGRERTNPCVIKDGLGRIKEVYYRAALIGRNLSGNLIVLVQTLVFSPDQYFTRNLYNIVKLGVNWDAASVRGRKPDMTEFGDAGRLAAIRIVDGEVRLRDGTLKAHEVVYAVDDTVGIVADLKSKKVNDVLAQKNEHQVNAVKLAQTFCERRLFSRHPGMPTARIPVERVQIAEFDRVDANGHPYDDSKVKEAFADVAVLGWLDSPEEQKLMMSIAAGLQRGASIDGAHVVEVDATMATPDLPVDDGDEVPRDEKIGAHAPAPMPPPKDQAPIEVKSAPVETPKQEPVKTEAPKAEPTPAPKSSPRDDAIAAVNAAFKKLRGMATGDSIANRIIGAQLKDGEEIIDLDDARLSKLRATVESQINQLEKKGSK